jgi:hypothetical protein
MNQRALLSDGQPLPVRSRVLQPGVGLGEGQIEKTVQDARDRLWQPTPNFPTPAALRPRLGPKSRESTMRYWALIALSIDLV